jgi:hypothetical protein
MATLSPVSVNAVTFGNPVDDPLENAPYVVSIWVSEKVMFVRRNSSALER